MKFFLKIVYNSFLKFYKFTLGILHKILELLVCSRIIEIKKFNVEIVLIKAVIKFIPLLLFYLYCFKFIIVHIKVK